MLADAFIAHEIKVLAAAVWTGSYGFFMHHCIDGVVVSHVFLEYWGVINLAVFENIGSERKMVFV